MRDGQPAADRDGDSEGVDVRRMKRLRGGGGQEFFGDGVTSIGVDVDVEGTTRDGGGRTKCY